MLGESHLREVRSVGATGPRLLAGMAGMVGDTRKVIMLQVEPPSSPAQVNTVQRGWCGEDRWEEGSSPGWTTLKHAAWAATAVQSGLLAPRAVAVG